MFIAFLKGLLFLFMVLLCLFLILIVLLQRGKGGGLVGAFGGAGGSSAFGAKTSDVFVKITVWTAIIWFVTCLCGRYVLELRQKSWVDSRPEAASTETGASMSAVPAADEASDSAAPTPAATAEGTDATAAPAAESAPAPAAESAPAPAADAPTPESAPAN